MCLCGSRRIRGERESGHKGTREVGNVDRDTEITFQFGAAEQDAESEENLRKPATNTHNVLGALRQTRGSFLTSPVSVVGLSDDAGGAVIL